MATPRSTKNIGALIEQIVRVPLGGSLDQGTDPLLIQPGQVATAENITYDKTGRVSKDLGIVDLPYKFQFGSSLGWTFKSVNLISEYKDSLIVGGRVVDQRGYGDAETHTRLCQYEEAHDAFDPSRLGSNTSRDNMWSPVGQENIPYSQSNSNLAWPGMAVTASYYWYSCVGPVASKVRLVAVEKTTQTRFQADMTLTGAIKTRLLEVGSKVILLCATATRIWGMYFSSTDPTTASAWVDLGLVNVAVGANSGWECCAYNNQFIISRIDNATGNVRFDLYSDVFALVRSLVIAEVVADTFTAIFTLPFPDNWVACTGTASSDLIIRNSHGLGLGDVVVFRSLVGGAGIVAGTRYYVVNPTANNFQISLTPGGAAVDFTTNMTSGEYNRQPYLGACWRTGNNIRFAYLIDDITAARSTYPRTLYAVGATDIIHTITGTSDLQEYYTTLNTQFNWVRILISRETTVATPSAGTAQVKAIDQAVIDDAGGVSTFNQIYNYIILSNATMVNGRVYLLIGNEHSGASLVTTGRNKTELIPAAWFGPEEVAVNKENLSQIHYDSSADKLYVTYNRNDYQNDFYATGKIFTMSDHCTGTQIDNGYVAGGGFIASFDGCPVDLGYWHPPEIKEVTSPIAGNLSAGTYTYYATYEWVDGNGEIHISQPSSSVDLVAALNDSGLLWIRPIALGSAYRNNNVKIVIYRNTILTPTIYFRVGEVYNSIFSSGVTYSDTMSDLTAETQPQLYTTGGVFMNSTPPPARILFRHQGRLWAINDDDKMEIWPSKSKVAGVAPEFCPEMTIRMPEECVGFGSQGDNLLILGKKRIYTVLGEGPNSIGVGAWPEPRPISFETGCNNERSVKRTDYGTVFQNERGIFAIGQGAALISEAVIDELGSKQVVGVVSELGAQTVRFFLSGAGSKALVYDFKHERWSTVSLGTGVTVGCAGSYGTSVVHYSSGDYKLRKTGTLYNLLGSKLTMKVVTPWINLMGLATFKRLWWIDIIGEWKGPHNLIVKISQDFVSTYDQIVTFNCSEAVSPYLLRIKPARQKCMAVKLEIYDDEGWLACTGTQSSNLINRNLHGYTAGEIVVFRSLVGGAGLTEGTTYYVVNPTTNSFQVSLSSGGSPVNFTTDITSGEFVKRGNSCTLTGLELHLATKSLAARTYGKDG